MKVLASTLIAFLLVSGCAEKAQSPVPSTIKSPGPVCSAFGGFEGQVCAVSIYALIANPSIYYGRTIAFEGYVHKSTDGTIAIYPNTYSAENSEIASAVLCTSAKIACDDYVGKHAEVFGRFTDTSVADFFFKPIGTIELMHVRSTKEVVGR